MRIKPSVLALTFALFIGALAQAKEPFAAMDVFKIAYAGDPVVSPNGHVVAFNRYYMDVMTDTRRSDLWVVGTDGKNLRQITEGFDAVGSAAFTPSGDAIAFVAVDGETSHIYLQTLDSGERIELGQDLSGASSLSFSPDGQWLAFAMPVDYQPETMGEDSSRSGRRGMGRANSR